MMEHDAETRPPRDVDRRLNRALVAASIWVDTVSRRKIFEGKEACWKNGHRKRRPSRNLGRGERIRTSDLSVPNRAHYQAVLRPVLACKSAIVFLK